MHTIHNQFTSPMCDRLETTCMGLGLVRLLQDAKRFEDAKAILYLLEDGFPGVAEDSDKADQQSSRTNHLIHKSASCLSASTLTKIDAAEMRPQSLSLA